LRLISAITLMRGAFASASRKFRTGGSVSIVWSSLSSGAFFLASATSLFFSFTTPFKNDLAIPASPFSGSTLLLEINHLQL
jgi:hypothetical protein